MLAPSRPGSWLPASSIWTIKASAISWPPSACSECTPGVVLCCTNDGLMCVRFSCPVQGVPAQLRRQRLGQQWAGCHNARPAIGLRYRVSAADDAIALRRLRGVRCAALLCDRLATVAGVLRTGGGGVCVAAHRGQLRGARVEQAQCVATGARGRRAAGCVRPAGGSILSAGVRRGWRVFLKEQRSCVIYVQINQVISRFGGL